jgi:hypothetical protein
MLTNAVLFFLMILIWAGAEYSESGLLALIICFFLVFIMDLIIQKAIHR